MRGRAIVAVGVLVSAAACGGDDDSGPEGATLRDTLTSGITVPVDPEPDAVSYHSTADVGSTPSEFDVLIAVEGGELSLQSDASGQLLLTGLSVDLGDLEVTPASFPPDGITFTDFHIELIDTASAAGTWQAGDGRVTATVTGDCTFDWSVVQDTGEPLPLAQQTVTGVTFDLDVETTADSSIRVVALGTRAGDFVDWSGLVTLSELSMQLGGSASL